MNTKAKETMGGYLSFSYSQKGGSMLDSNSSPQRMDRGRALKPLLSWLPIIVVLGLWLTVSFDWTSEVQTKRDLSSLMGLYEYIDEHDEFASVTIKNVSQYLSSDNVPTRRTPVEFSFPKPLENSGRPLFVTGYHIEVHSGFDMAYVFKGRLKTEGRSEKYVATDFDRISIQYLDLESEASRVTIEDSARLIAQLRKKKNRAQFGPYIVPGGETINYSIQMKLLMMLGNSVCEQIVPLLDDPELEFEAVLILGAIGDISTVRLLINRYPDAPDPPTKSYNRLAVAYTNALCNLTGELIGRSRYGSDCEPKNKALWEKWWNTHPEAWKLSGGGANTTAAPSYPSLKQEDMDHARESFAKGR